MIVDLKQPTRVAVCDLHPISIHGIRSLLATRSDLTLAGVSPALVPCSQLQSLFNPDIVIVDKGFGIKAVIDWLNENGTLENAPATVIWGSLLNEPEVLQYLQAGAKGVLRKTAEVETVLSCLLAVSTGKTWMEEDVFGEPIRLDRFAQTELTPRETQVMQLVEQGLKNREVARQLGIRPGTVKIHLRHIFEKTGVRGRYGLALQNLKHRGVITDMGQSNGVYCLQDA